jgi:hypothetical protein
MSKYCSALACALCSAGDAWRFVCTVLKVHIYVLSVRLRVQASENEQTETPYTAAFRVCKADTVLIIQA